MHLRFAVMQVFLHVIGAAALMNEAGSAGVEDLASGRVLINELCYKHSGGCACHVGQGARAFA
jgi:hypothetical protein